MLFLNNSTPQVRKFFVNKKVSLRGVGGGGGYPLNGRKPLLRFSSPSLYSLRVFKLKLGGTSINIGRDRYPGSFHLRMYDGIAVFAIEWDCILLLVIA